MPTYEYECTKGHQFEVEQRITDDPLKRCRVCRASVRRLISNSTFILKGGGWYADGYGSSKSNGSSKSSESSSSSGSESKAKSDKSGKSDSGKSDKSGKSDSGSSSSASSD